MGLLDFLFGKKPKVVFKPDGTVVHNHKKSYWDRWKNRFLGPDYDWRNHSGLKRINKL